MEAYVTLVATEAYASGTLVLSHKLRDLGSKKEIICMVTPNITSRVQDILSKVCTVIQVDELRSADFDNLKLLGRLDLDISITKIQLWRLTQYKKLVFLDADTLPLRNIDELFDRPCFSAAPDSGWPDCFNSGVFITEPSESTYQDLISLASQKGSFDGGDQGLLNTYFSTWPATPEHRLPFTFNTTPTTQYGYAPAHNEYGRHISVIHFIGENKPWKYQRFADGKVLPLGNAWEGLRDMVQSWWDTWDKFYGRTTPYQLLSGDFDQKFDDGFQTRPIVPFDESVSNAWDNQDVDLDNERRQVYPMPPLSSITIGQPEWLKEETRRREEEERKRKYEEEERHNQQHQHDKHLSQENPRNKVGHYHHKQDHQEEHHHNEQHHQETKTYAMIEWDPAHQSPPNTGSLGAYIPNLTNFKNVWDQPSSEKQVPWVAPVNPPEPQIMAKPEYSQYNIDDYEPNHHHLPFYAESRSSALTEKEKSHHHHHEEQHQPEYPPSFPWDYVADHFPPPTRIWPDESQHCEPEYRHPSTEPECQALHRHQPFETMHERCLEQQIDDKGEEHDDPSVVVKQAQANDYQETHKIHAQHYNQQRPETSKEEVQPLNKDINQQEEPDQALFAIDKAVNPSMQNKIEEFMASLNTEDTDISDRDLIPIKFKPTSRLQTGMYTPSPIRSPVNSRNGSRRASVSSTRRASVHSSRRNSITTTNTAMSPKNKLPLSAASLGSSVAAITDAVPSSGVRSTTQNAKLFATASASVFRKTPYTSASVTPALAETPDGYERHDYFYSDNEEEDGEGDENGLAAIAPEQDRSDFLYDRRYSLTERLMIETVEPAAEWDALGSLAKLKEHSESLVLRQSLQEALVKTAQQQQEEDEEMSAAVDKKLLDIIKAEEGGEKTSIRNDHILLPTSMKKKFKSSWDDEEYELPSALASGESTPRTPVARRLSSSDLTKLLALEKERFRQQRESLKMAKPQAAVASMLEAELDLSRGLLHQRRQQRVTDSDNNDNENGGMNATSLSDASNGCRQILTGEESGDNENQELGSLNQCAAYYDEHVILEAQKRLSALITGDDVEKEIEPMPLPVTNQTHAAVTSKASPETSSANSHPFGSIYNFDLHHANFGFDENHKVQIYQSDLLPTDESMENFKTLNSEIIACRNNPIEKQMVAKEEEEAGQKLGEERLKMLAANEDTAAGNPILDESAQKLLTSESAVSIINPELDTSYNTHKDLALSALKSSSAMTGETSSILEPPVTNTTELASIPVSTSKSIIEDSGSSFSMSKNLKSESSSSTVTTERTESSSNSITMTSNSKKSIKIDKQQQQ